MRFHAGSLASDGAWTKDDPNNRRGVTTSHLNCTLDITQQRRVAAATQSPTVLQEADDTRASTSTPKIVHDELADCHRVATMRHVGCLALRRLARVCGPYHVGDVRHARTGLDAHTEGAAARHARTGQVTHTEILTSRGLLRSTESWVVPEHGLDSAASAGRAHEGRGKRPPI